MAVTRNLAMVEQRYGLDTYCFCNGCFGYNTELKHIIDHNPDYKKMANDLIGSGVTTTKERLRFIMYRNYITCSWIGLKNWWYGH